MVMKKSNSYDDISRSIHNKHDKFHIQIKITSYTISSRNSHNTTQITSYHTMISSQKRNDVRWNQFNRYISITPTLHNPDKIFSKEVNIWAKTKCEKCHYKIAWSLQINPNKCEENKQPVQVNETNLILNIITHKLIPEKKINFKYSTSCEPEIQRKYKMNK